MVKQISPPGLVLRLLEGRAATEAAQLMLQMPLLRLRAERGQGEPVLVLPGFMADDLSTAILRGFLSAIGYQAAGWGQGLNRGRMLDFMAPVTGIVADMAREYQQPVRLVGWSRGGILAREIARDRPDLVARVITIGSPVKGGSRISSIGRFIRRETGLTAAQIRELLRAREQKPITVPIRAIYSRLDGVVAWQACIDDQNPDVEHYQIRGSHIGMGTNAEVFRLLPRLLKDGGR